MRLNHIALNIHQADELFHFYQNILGLHLVHQFNLSEELSLAIFGLNQTLPVFLYTDGPLYLELFLFEKPVSLGVAHVCLETSDRENMADACATTGYTVKRITREGKPDLLFIEDKAGNL